MADDVEANEFDLEDVAVAASAKSVDGVKQKPLYKTERQIPEPVAPADNGNLYGQAAPGESRYERGVFHPAKEKPVPGYGAEPSAENAENVEGGEDPEAYEEGGEQAGHSRTRGTSQVQGNSVYEDRIAAEQAEDSGSETETPPAAPGAGERVAGAAQNVAEDALKAELKESLAVETGGASAVVLWAKDHPQAAIAIACALLLVVLMIVVLAVVLIGEFACNGTVASVSSWIYGHIGGGTDYCSQLPKIS